MFIQHLLDEFCHYSSYMRGYSKETIRRYRVALDIYMKDTGVREMEYITDQSIRAFFLKGRVERKWNPNSFITYHKSLVVFFRWCVENGYMTTNFADDIEIPKKAKKLPSRLNKHDALKLLEFVYNYPYANKFLRYRNHAIFATFLFAGLRKQELLNLGNADVDLDGLSIFVRQGKGAKDRIIPMSSRLAEILGKYSVERVKLKSTCPEFFVSSTLNMGFTKNGLKLLVKNIKNRSKINFGAHKLRHTFATLMLEGGCDIYSLSKMMGHSDIKTTTIYMAASAEHLRSQIYKHPLNT